MIHVNLIKVCNYGIKHSHPQSKARSSLQEKELKDSLQRVQEEAQKQLELVNGQLLSRSGELKEKEKELTEMRYKLEGEVASLQQQLLARGEELQTAQKNITEVTKTIGHKPHCLYECLVRLARSSNSS